MGVRLESLPDSVRTKSKDVLGFLLSDILESPMFDPLDGGVFSSRVGPSWELPGFYRDSLTQARVITGLMEAYDATGLEKARQRALGVLKYVEENSKTPEGLFSLGSEYRGRTEKWLWQMSELRKVLNEEERKKVVAVIGDSTFLHTGINGLMDMVYNKSTATVLILDNSTTGMTRRQDNPSSRWRANSPCRHWRRKRQRTGTAPTISSSARTEPA